MTISELLTQLKAVQVEASGIEDQAEAAVRGGMYRSAWKDEDKGGTWTRYLQLQADARGLIRQIKDALPTHPYAKPADWPEGEPFPTHAGVLAATSRAILDMWFERPEEACEKYLEAGEHAGLSQWISGFITGMMIPH